VFLLPRVFPPELTLWCACLSRVRFRYYAAERRIFTYVRVKGLSETLCVVASALIDHVSMPPLVRARHIPVHD